MEEKQINRRRRSVCPKGTKSSIQSRDGVKEKIIGDVFDSVVRGRLDIKYAKENGQPRIFKEDKLIGVVEESGGEHLTGKRNVLVGSLPLNDIFNVLPLFGVSQERLGNRYFLLNKTYSRKIKELIGENFFHNDKNICYFLSHRLNGLDGNLVSEYYDENLNLIKRNEEKDGE